MRVSNPIKLYVPTEIQRILQNKVSRNIENYYYIVHDIITKRMALKYEQKDSEKEFLPINSENIKTVINKETNSYIKLLTKYEIIMSDNIYEKGKKKLHYKLNPEIIKDNNFVELLPNTKLYNSLVKRVRLQKSNYVKLPYHLYQMYKKFKAMDFDYASAIDWINNCDASMEKKMAYYYSVEQLRDDRYRYFKVSKTNNRLNTNLTNLKSDLRQFIIGDYVSIDLKNSQPFFFSVLIDYLNLSKKVNTNFIDIEGKELYQSYINSPTIPLCCIIKFSGILQTVMNTMLTKFSKIRILDDNLQNTNLSLFKEWCISGKMYDNFLEYYENKYSRKEIKNLMFKVFFSHNEKYIDYKKVVPYKTEKDIFAKVFPEVYKFICAFKKSNTTDFPVTLQKIESEVFINQISKRLVENNIVPFTIHDSIIVERENVSKALSVIESVFIEYFYVIPKFETKSLKTV